jgi:RsiW-degrading membrane proteinase PrsW (M82 family)
MDGIIYASRAGLGFALVENVMYLSLVATSVEEQMTMWLLRAVFAVPGHAMWTGMIGAMAARRRFDFKGLGLIGGYLLAVAFHGAYDLALFAQKPMQLEGHTELARFAVAIPILMTVAAFFVLRSMARTALRLDDGDAARAAAAAAMRIAPAPTT